MSLMPLILTFVRLINDLHLLWADPAVSVFLLLLAVLSVFIMFVIKFKCYTFDDKRLSFKRGLFKKREYVDWSDIRKMVIKDGGFYGSVIVEIDVEDKEIWLRNELKGAGKRFYELLEEHTPKDAFEKIRYVVHKTEGGILWKAPK